MAKNESLTEVTYYILLSLLDERHGYGIMKNIEELSEGRIHVAAGTMYSALVNLTKQGLIKPLEAEEDTRRKKYILTEMGKEVLVKDYKRVQRQVIVSERLLGGV